jgi:hypothetical protein
VRFLTRAWHAGHTSDEEAEEIGAAYRAHRMSVLPQLPERFRVFAETIDIHDARVREIRLDWHAGTLAIDLRAGDLQAGYFDLGIRYAGVDVGALDTRALAAIGQNPRAEALYHEVDVAPGEWYEHRWLWWPYQELDVRFRGFAFVTEPRPDRAFDRPTESYVEIGEPAA